MCSACACAAPPCWERELASRPGGWYERRKPLAGLSAAILRGRQVKTIKPLDVTRFGDAAFCGRRRLLLLLLLLYLLAAASASAAATAATATARPLLLHHGSLLCCGEWWTDGAVPLRSVGWPASVSACLPTRRRALVPHHTYEHTHSYGTASADGGVRGCVLQSCCPDVGEPHSLEGDTPKCDVMVAVDQVERIQCRN